MLEMLQYLPNRKEGFPLTDRTVLSRDAGEGIDQPHYRRGDLLPGLCPSADERTKGWQNA
ncbi:hypothetical protein DK867_09800 [Ochrobactrum sp. POC9]|nr:hypothetical protein DK867_09800 [Ochrobactrum sp. POC9]